MATETRWTDALLDRMRRVADPEADEPVAAVFGRDGLARVNQVMGTLVRTDQPVPAELPSELRAFLTTTLPLPEWADMDKIERAQNVFETWGVQISVCLFCASLPSSYAAAQGVRVLYLSSDLQRQPHRRAMETGQFLFDVLTPGGLAADGRGRRTIQKVRLMHAAVRRNIEARADLEPDTWDRRWGRPINQEDLAGTLLSFSYAVVEPLARLGISLSDEEIDSYIHLWNVVGHELGIRDELLVRDVADATDLVAKIRERHFRGSAEGQEMMLALLNLLDDMTPGELLDGYVPALIRHLIGDDVATMLLVPESRFTPQFGRLRGTVNWALDRVLGDARRDARRYRLMTRLAEPFGRNMLRAFLALERGGERASFSMPDRLHRTWNLADVTE